MDNAFLRNVINFFQSAVESLAILTNWLWTPWEDLDWLATALEMEHITPVMVLTSSAIIVILALHIVHLVNVISG